MDSSSFSKIIDEIIIAFKASNWEVIGSYVASILYPMFVGGIIIAIIIGIITYKFVFKSLVEYKEIKSRKILKEAK